MLSAFDSEDHDQQFSLSWTAYLKPFFIFVVLFCAGVSVFVIPAHDNVKKGIGALICLVAIVYFTYRVLYLHSVTLYTDASGVWVYRGIFPWSKGANGVMWRDLEDAAYYTGFWSWILRSYAIRVGHRFTKTSEIILTNVSHGNLAVQHINSVVRNFVANNVDNR